MGLDPVPVSPHVFALDEARLRYAHFPRGQGGFDFGGLDSIELPANTFLDGLLGGPLREPAVFSDLLGKFVRRIPETVKDASFVIPDAWLRVAFVELNELPRTADSRLEVLRWKLRRQVPFRVDELRLGGVETRPLATQQQPHRILLGFAIELLLSQIEDAFAAQQIRLGQITNASLSLLSALHGFLNETELTAVVLIQSGGYTLLFAQGGEPVLFRYKSLSDTVRQGSALEPLVVRDLALTRSFLEEHLPGTPLQRVLLAGPKELEAPWLVWLGECFDRQVESLEPHHLPLATPRRNLPWHELAPLLGAASQEVF